MSNPRPIHADFQLYLDLKSQEVTNLFCDLREYVLELYPDSTELLYHTHALTAAFSVSERLSDAFCMIPIYTNHMNLGFNRGVLLEDPHELLIGTGKLMRHLAVKAPGDYRNAKVKALIKASIDFALEDMDKPAKSTGTTISKIKKK